MEKEIELEQEAIVVYSGGGAVNSVNGYTGDVILTTSDLENTSDYQTGTEVESAISTAIAGKQDTLTAGNNITISNNTISATDTTYSAGTGLTLDGTQFSVNTETIATQQDVSNEATARENADINLQGQIDAISSASDVTDIVGTYAALQAYDTTHLKDNDIIKVLQDESQNDETTYYRWSTSTQTFTLIGEEGPYYTKSQTDTLLQAKQDNLTAGANITIASDNTISATDTTYTAGTNVSISSGNVISATDTTYSDFTGTDGTAAGTAGLVPAPATTDAGKFLKADGTWDTAGGSGPTVVQTTGTSTTDVMSQNATTSMVYADPETKRKVKIASTQSTVGNDSVAIGYGSSATPNNTIALGKNAFAAQQSSMAIGLNASANGSNSIALGRDSVASTGELAIGTSSGNGYNNSQYRLLTGVYDPQSAHDAATKGYVDAITLTNAGAPTTSTVGTVGQLLEDTTNGKLYICTDTTGGTYTWEEVGAGGGGPTVVQTTGNSTTDVMSQKAATSMVFDPNNTSRIKIGAGATATQNTSITLGAYTSNYGIGAVALGWNSTANSKGSVALGAQSDANGVGVVSIGGVSDKSYGYNSSSYRLLTGLYDGQSAHDAATKGQLDSIAIQNAGAPTTATVGTVGQLLEDTTNGKLYICTDTTGGTYTWEEVGAGGGGGPTVVQTTGTSTTDVMSQNATTSMVFKDPGTNTRVRIGAGADNVGQIDGVSIGKNANDGIGLGKSYVVGIGSSAKAGAEAAVAIGLVSSANGAGSIALGARAKATSQGEMNIGTTQTSYGYNSSNYRLLTGLYDPQSAHDAATKGYVDPTTDSSAPTTATVGRLGQIQIDTTTATAYMCVAVDTVTPAYTWKQITA